jgi:bifunctional non-homologous end joining protein LigD
MAQSNSHAGRFVVQRHESRSPHYDLRLERDGVYKSWAVPKGIPEEPGLQRLALQVEDHALEFGDFEGTIPEGEHGAGEVTVWDRGACTIVEWTDTAIRFRLDGTRLNAEFLLVRFPRKGPREWLLRQASRGS